MSEVNRSETRHRNRRTAGKLAGWIGSPVMNSIMGAQGWLHARLRGLGNLVLGVGREGQPGESI